jgi:hypothetical protein
MYAGIAEGLTGIGMAVGGYYATEQAQEAVAKHRELYPTYTIPASIEEQTQILRQRAQQGLPGEDLISSQIQQQTAQGVAGAREASTSAADLLGATTQLYGAQSQNLTNLQIESARQRAQNEMALAQGLGQRAGYEEQAFIFNEAIPWQTRMNELMNIQQSAADLVTQGFATQTASYETFAGSGGGSVTDMFSF